MMHFSLYPLLLNLFDSVEIQDTFQMFGNRMNDNKAPLHNTKSTEGDDYCFSSGMEFFISDSNVSYEETNSKDVIWNQDYAHIGRLY